MEVHNPKTPPTDEELDDVNVHWDEAGRTYDPNRGDHVDHLNDTTPRIEPITNGRDKQKRKKRSKKVWIVLAVLVIGTALYIAVVHQSSKSTAKSVTAAVVPQKTPSLTTKHYDSTNYALGLDYPISWKLNDGDTMLTMISPKTSFETATSKQVDGYIQVSIQNMQTALPAFAKGSAIADIQSQKISYKHPTQNQRAQSYVTFASYVTTAGNGLDALYVTGDNAYEVGQAIPQADIIQDDPLISVQFLNCSDQSCNGTPTSYTLSASEWNRQSFSLPILTILESLSIN